MRVDMKINEIINKFDRNFTAIYKCEYCGYKTTKRGYDDNHYMRTVLPDLKCDACGKSSRKNIDRRCAE